MAVCTNKQEHLAVDLLKKIGINHFFEYILSSLNFVLVNCWDITFGVDIIPIVITEEIKNCLWL